ncbi:MAG: PAS domain S-box protein [Bacteroidia bacterium]|nr:PAS domain S-box protein [Bacteroidia bacterium]
MFKFITDTLFRQQKNTVKFSVLGFLIGLIFPAAGTLLALRTFPAAFSVNDLLALHLSVPLLQIIDLAPFVLLLSGLILGLRTDQLIELQKNQSKKDKYRSLVENAVEVVYITDYKGNFIYFNQRVEKVYGFKPQELIGSHFTSLIKPSMTKKVAAFYLNQFENKTPETISDFQIIDKSGKPRWVEQTVILIAKDNRVEGFHGVLRDIDARIEQAQEIVKLNSLLHGKVAELETVNGELDAFNHTVSHDLRSPLRGLATLAEIMQMEFGEQLPEEAKELLSRMIVSTDKIQLLVEDLLRFAKVGRQEIIMQPVSMRGMVENILENSLPKDPENKTSVQVDQLADAICDEQLIQQVWVNFISNALKYSSKRETPLIRIGNYFKNDEQVYFVKDNGAGFDMTYYKKLFGVFSRLHSDSEFIGTGVGLSIVKRIVERHGGKVWAEGKPDEGATFYFSLPVKNTSSKITTEQVSGPVFYTNSN